MNIFETEQSGAFTPVNLYSRLFFQIENALSTYHLGDLEKAQGQMKIALGGWDTEQAFESYFLDRLNSGSEIEVQAFYRIISRKKIKNFSRTLAKLG